MSENNTPARIILSVPVQGPLDPHTFPIVSFVEGATAEDAMSTFELLTAAPEGEEFDPTYPDDLEAGLAKVEGYERDAAESAERPESNATIYRSPGQWRVVTDTAELRLTEAEAKGIMLGALKYCGITSARIDAETGAWLGGWAK